MTDKFGVRKGVFVDVKTGEKLGEHEGSYLYTIGQRKGIGIAAPYPLYVIDIDAKNNVVYLGRNEDNFYTEANICDLRLSYPIKEEEFDAKVKIRYNMPAQKAHVEISGSEAKIKFLEPINSVTKGQAGVFYDMIDGHLIGGGKVC